MLFRSPLPYLSDVSPYYDVLRALSWPAWLDSGGRGRFDILVAQPVMTMTSAGGKGELKAADGSIVQRGEPFTVLREALGAKCESLGDIPFAGGALGYLGYELGWRDRSGQPRHDQGMPELAIGIYDWALVIDHQKHEAALVSQMRYPQTADQLAGIEALIRRGMAQHRRELPSFRVLSDIRSNFSYSSYGRAFAAIQRYLHEGDCYQVNLTQRFSAKVSGDAYQAYQRLRQLSPAPFAGFLDWPQGKILCASPERFLRVEHGRVETKPIKGTRRRSQDPGEDARLKDELRHHPKDRAENLMIVDLLRNDLGRCCVAGSVRTPGLFEVESHANVHHLVSTVEGVLLPECDALDVLQASFPGGSITGAPKQRAMQIIEELEPDARGVYCGSIGYIGFDGNMDTNIAIRTMLQVGQIMHCWAGGGIVADSQCRDEYQESLDKASAMLAVLQEFGGRLSLED